MKTTSKKRLHVLNKFGGRCAYCGRRLSEKTMTVDHMKPKSRGGGNGTDNLMPACNTCNSLKGKMTVGEFRRMLCRLSASVASVPAIRLAMRFGLLPKGAGFCGEFYFEKILGQERLEENSGYLFFEDGMADDHIVTYADGCVTLDGRKVISCGKDGLEIWRGGSDSFPACAKIKALGMRLFVAIRRDGKPFIRRSPKSAAALMGVSVDSLIRGTESR